MNYYNENDAEKAACLRQFILDGLIAPGEVDERSIKEIEPRELTGFGQCHFFAGFGVWSYALRLAGWPDDRPVWTGSCPCPSFSCAGKGTGFNDPRHLWPAWFGLIRECRPATIFGEQSDDAIGYGWLDLVQSDLESEAYAVGKAVLGACSVGAPHIRQRLYFGANAKHAERRSKYEIHGDSHRRNGFGRSGDAGSRPDLQGERWARRQNDEDGRRRELASGCDGEIGNGPNSNGRIASDRDLQRSGEQRLFAQDCGTGGCEHSAGMLAEQFARQRPRPGEAESWRSRCELAGPGNSSDMCDAEIRGQSMCWLSPGIARHAALAGATRGFWADCDWWYGRDGKYRPIKSGIQPLAHGAAYRVLKLRGYGDAIVPEVAQAFIESFEDAVIARRILAASGGR